MARLEHPPRHLASTSPKSIHRVEVTPSASAPVSLALRERASNPILPTRPKVRQRQPHHSILHTRPPEPAVRQPLGEQAHSCAVPIDQLHPVGPVSPGTHRQRRQALGALAAVDRLRRYQHPNRAGRTDHAPAFKARSTAATVFASAPRPMRMVTPSISTSMLPQLRLAWPVRLRCRPRSTVGGNAVSTMAGTNCGALLSVFASGRRACRRLLRPAVA
jgi:hypothetical protein